MNPRKASPKSLVRLILVASPSYHTANAFSEQDEMKLTVWRGDKLLPITVVAPDRTIGIQLRTYPVEGYREK